ncbi:MAG: DUF6778 family protein [Pseudomonadota bacterium]
MFNLYHKLALGLLLFIGLSTHSMAQEVTTQSGIGSKFRTYYDQPLPQSLTSGWNVTRVEIIIPERLTVSEQNTLAPNADIVWHGDPRGDRKAQIAAILEAAGTLGAQDVNAGQNVHLVLQLEEFHGATPYALRKLRFSGVYNITFLASVHDGPTSEPIIDPTPIYADLEAFSGARFAQAEAEGNTQKKRVTSHIAAVLAGWMNTGPDPRREILRRGR